MSAPHLHLIAVGAFLGDLDCFGQGDIGLGDQDVGSQNVLIGANQRKDGTCEGNQAPQENPHQHPGKAQHHTLDGCPVLEAVKEVNDLNLFTAVAVQIDHHHGGAQQQGNGKAQHRDAHAAQCDQHGGQDAGQQGNTPKLDGLLHENSQRTLVNCHNHNL